MQETDSIANAETAHVYTIEHIEYENSLYFGTHWIRKLVHWTDNSHVRKRCILTTMLCIPCVTTQHLHTISIVYIKCTGQLCWSIASAVPVCIMSDIHVFVDMHCHCLLGRHGSDSLCRDERENKMAATYNVLAFKRWYFAWWWILYVQNT